MKPKTDQEKVALLREALADIVDEIAFGNWHYVKSIERKLVKINNLAVRSLEKTKDTP